MMNCFSTSHTDGTDETHHVSLRSLMAAKQTPVPSTSMAKKIIERKLGLSTRKTLQARTNLLDTACHNLAKAKQRTFVAYPPSYYLKADTILFPLPLPPGYKPSANTRSSSKSRALSNSSSLSKCSSNSIQSEKTDVDCGNPASNFPATCPLHVQCCTCTSSSVSPTSPTSPFHCHSNSTTSCHSSACEALTPFSSTSSSVFSAAPSSLSLSSSFSSSSTNSCELRCNSLAHAFEIENSFSTPLPTPSAHKVHAAVSSLKEFSPLEIARACDNFDDTNKLRNGSMGLFFRAFLLEEQSFVTIARVETELSRRKWRAQVQAIAKLEHPNVCKVIGFSYERGSGNMEGRGGEGMREVNTGCIVYENMNVHESLEEFVQDVEKGQSHIDWPTRLHIAIGVAEGLSFLLQNHINYGDLTLSNILVDSSSNAKLFDFNFSIVDRKKEEKASVGVQTLGNLLLKLFDFISYSPDKDNLKLNGQYQVQKSYPPSDAEVVIQLVASCLLVEDSLCPSVQHVACVLRSMEPTLHKAKFSLNRSKSFTYRREKSLSFG